MGSIILDLPFSNDYGDKWRLVKMNMVLFYETGTSGYNNILFIAIRSHGINYACTLRKTSLDKAITCL